MKRKRKETFPLQIYTSQEERIAMKNQCRRHKRWFHIGLFVLGLLLPLTLTLNTAVLPKATAQTPSSYSRNQALYVTMRDGVKIAIDVWLPKDLPSGTRIPTIM
ncbi:hypothetical protein [Scytonema sp. UIC 10036]|uniref:hypothetical protein n=1 Tax=Scytonema sp. UIC 10036 TaxID=2304196 RepID=UPI001A9ABC4E|nr:hypothetical protein [Scytonema sp. UIC 10036]